MSLLQLVHPTMVLTIHPAAYWKRSTTVCLLIKLSFKLCQDFHRTPSLEISVEQQRETKRFDKSIKRENPGKIKHNEYPKFSSVVFLGMLFAIQNYVQNHLKMIGRSDRTVPVPAKVTDSPTSPYGAHHQFSRTWIKLHRRLSTNQALFQTVLKFPSNSFCGSLWNSSKTSGSDKSTWVEILEKINKNENSKFSSVVFLGMLFAIQNYVQNHLKMIGRSDRTVWKNSIK